jgi:multimeric flavodoxin WrbA
LKRSPEPSHTEGLAERSIKIMERTGVAVELVRAVDRAIATGVQPDMTEYGWEEDDWPATFDKVMAADILVLLSPIWLLNDAGQYAYYGRVAAASSPATRTGPSTAR